MRWPWSHPVFSDDVIDLWTIRSDQPDPDMGFGRVMDFIITPHLLRREAGRISVRMGESDCIYYFGHIGYHIDPPYRGNAWAVRACKLVAPLYQFERKDSITITCDPDNYASRRTCEKLGCILERVVEVPKGISDQWIISSVKCRYIWKIARL